MITELTHKEERLSMELQWIPETSGLKHCHWKKDQKQEDRFHPFRVKATCMAASRYDQNWKNAQEGVRRIASGSDQHLRKCILRKMAFSTENGNNHTGLWSGIYYFF